jgi:dienelactone hydrolase
MRTGVVRDRAGGATFEDIPVIWALPPESTATPQLVIWLAGGLEPMQTTLPMLERLTSAGFAAVSFDSAGRGSRAPQDIEAVWPRALANWPNVVWPITAQGALETLRVIDWAARAFDLKRPYAVGGQSAGGDIAIAAAGLDPRISCVASVVATPDWRRPGMHADGELVPPGEPDAYARYLYNRINPLTNLRSYAHRPAMTFECGADDDHVPADGALRFQAALAPIYGRASNLLRVNLHPGVGHQYAPAMLDNCIEWLEAHARAGGPA